MQTFHREFRHAEFSVKNPIRIRVRNELVDAGPREKEKKRKRKKGRGRGGQAGRWGQCAAADLQPAWPKYAYYEPGIFFFLFIFVALDGRPISRFCSLSHAATLCGDHSPGRPFFFFSFMSRCSDGHGIFVGPRSRSPLFSIRQDITCGTGYCTWCELHSRRGCCTDCNR